MDLEDTARSTETIVEASKVDTADAKLPESGSAHDARLHRDIKIGLLEHIWRVFLENLCQSYEFGVSSTLYSQESADRNSPMWSQTLRVLFV